MLLMKHCQFAPLPGWRGRSSMIESLKPGAPPVFFVAAGWIGNSLLPVAWIQQYAVASVATGFIQGVTT